MNRGRIHPMALLACVAVIFGMGAVRLLAAEAHDGHAVSSHASSHMLAELSGALQELASKVSPAVVLIEVTGYGPSDGGGRRDAALIVRQRAIGAGVVVDPDGYIMTNAHVVEGAQQIRVTLLSLATRLDGSVVRQAQVLHARVVGLSKETDLALLKVDARNLPTIQFNLKHPAQPGELVFAIGSPEGLQNSVSMGVISSAWRQLDLNSPMVYLQTDAPINPGSSGGPLVDCSGAVIGLNTFILSNGGGSEGLGFAIPARVVDFVYHNLKKYGHVRRIVIGATAQPITAELAEGLLLAQNWGVVISDVAPEGPAGAAGVKPGDVVSAVDGHQILDLPGFAVALALHVPDQTVKIDVLRGTQRLSLDVPAIPAHDPMDQFADFADPVKSYVDSLGILGLTFDDRLHSLLPEARMSTGVIVVGRAPGFSTIDVGLRAGDVVHSLNRTPVESVEQLKSALAQLKQGDAAVLRIERQGQFQYLAFEME